VEVGASTTVPYLAQVCDSTLSRWASRSHSLGRIALVKTEPQKLLKAKIQTGRNFLRHDAELPAGSTVSRREKQHPELLLTQ
jgi:hypothetical protein